MHDNIGDVSASADVQRSDPSIPVRRQRVSGAAESVSDRGSMSIGSACAVCGIHLPSLSRLTVLVRVAANGLDVCSCLIGGN